MKKTKPIKKVALIHALPSVGKASLTNMLPILSYMEIEACPIPTVIMSTNTGKYGKPVMRFTDGQYLIDAANHYLKEDVHFDMIFIGYIGDIKLIEGIKYFIRRFPKTPVVFDPIMGDNGHYYSNFSDDYGKALLGLMKEVDLILPNLTESLLLISAHDPKIEDIADFSETNFNNSQMIEMTKYLQGLGSKNVIITSITDGRKKKGVAVYYNQNFEFILSASDIETKTHGTGDCFDAVCIGCILRGLSIAEAAKKADYFVTKLIEESNKYDYPTREGLLVEKALKYLDEI
ncbi:MAG: bifunctional hydroxymethylpyrimidine kinase/phosphomethylpyrimidine kinase [Lachnospiraceae bacterium]|jgi:pyridoxine kinase|nr:bifunctional hydroxymethylpyrimidine kinase/phosphomethylpyrimidine kinase [Lachnospiraceae bacterium]